MDDADRADARIENVVDDALAEARRKPRLIAAGFCHYCAETVQPGHLFCDKECASDYDYEQARRKANGL